MYFPQPLFTPYVRQNGRGIETEMDSASAILGKESKHMVMYQFVAALNSLVRDSFYLLNI